MASSLSSKPDHAVVTHATNARLEQYWVWHGLFRSYASLKKQAGFQMDARRRHDLRRQICIQFFKNFFHYPLWLFSLLVPSFFKGDVTLWSNIKTIAMRKEFRPLRLALVSQLVFVYAILHIGFIVFHTYATPTLAATYTWTQSEWLGSSAFTASHSTDQTGWDVYSAVSSTVLTGETLLLDTSVVSSTQQLEEDFSNGTHTSTTAVASGGESGGCTPNVSSFPYTEGFESGIGYWSQGSGDDTDWTRQSGGTSSSGTGPTSAAVGTYYMYVESSSPYYPSKSALFNGPCFDLTAVSSAMISFQYHMYGADMGNLYLEASTDGNSWNQVWTLSGDQGNVWHNADVSLNTYAGGTLQLRFRGITGASFTSDMSIDDIEVTVSGSAAGVEGDGSVYLAQYELPGDSVTIKPLQARIGSTYYSCTSNWNYNMGYRFTANANGTVTQLGAMVGSTGGVYTVRLYAYPSGSVLATANITGQGAAHWVYSSITPVSLTTGSTYVVAVRLSSQLGCYKNSMVPFVQGDISVLGSSYYYGADSMPTNLNTSYQYGMADITFVTGSASTEAYYDSGTFISSVIDTGGNTGFTTLDYAIDTPDGTSITVDVRSGNTDTPDGTWTSWQTDIADGGSIAALGNNRYVQYRLTLTTSDDSVSPSLSSITFNYDQYQSGTLVSSPFDAGNAENVLASVSWNGTTPTGSAIKLQARTSPNGSSWTEWMGPDGTSGTYFTDASGDQDMPESLGDGVNDQWIQYRALLDTDGATTPIVSDITMTYVVNEPPTIVINVTSTLATDGTVTIPYNLRDIDTNEGAHPGSVTVHLEYCTLNCSSSGGETWQEADDSTITGDIGTVSVATGNAALYTPHSLVWTPRESYSGQYNATDFKVRLVADDLEAANNFDIAETNMFLLDTASPVVSVTMDGRADSDASLTFDVTEDTVEGMAMRLSNNSDLSSDGVNPSSGSWVDFASTTDWTFGDNNTVYYQVRDAYGNISNAGAIGALNGPETPAQAFISDISNATTENWREFFVWNVVEEPDAGFAEYRIYRSTDGSTYSLFHTETDRTINYIIDTGLDAETTYYYKVVAVDSDGNISPYSSAVQDVPNAQGTADLLAPTISNVSMTSSTPTSITFTWETNELANSALAYTSLVGGDFSGANVVEMSTMKDTADHYGIHRVTLTGLTPEQTYYVEVRSTDPFGNAATSKDGANGYQFTTTEGPTISNVAIESIGNTQAVVTWATDQDSDSYVVYDTDILFGDSQQMGSATAVTDHRVTLTGLSPETTYYFYVKSGVSEDKQTIDGADVYYSIHTGRDTTPPSIFFDEEANIESSDSNIVVTFTTNEQATSSLAYGTSNSYGETLVKTSYNTNHRFVVPDLIKGTTYYFRAYATDREGNVSTPLTFTADTSDTTDYVPPVLSSVTTTIVTDNQALITWDTNELASSTVLYGTTSSSLHLTQSKNGYNAHHAITLSSLATSTVYYYSVRSVDQSGNVVTSDVQSFTTLEALSEEQEILLREAQALERGRQAGSAASGSSGGGGTLIVHTGGGTRDTTPPSILKSAVSNMTGTTATVSIETDEASDAAIEFGTGTSYERAAVDWEVSSGHTISLVDLLPLTTYYYRLSVGDSAGNRSQFVTGKFSTTLASADISALESSLDTIENPEQLFVSSLERASDIIKSMSSRVSAGALEQSLVEQAKAIKEISSLLPAPLIGGEPRVEMGATYATISWDTDKVSTSLVSFAPQEVYMSSASGTYDQTTGYPKDAVTSHRVTLQDLRPGTKYHYRVISESSSGAKNQSADFTFETKTEQSAVISYTFTTSTDGTRVSWVTSVPTDSVVTYAPYRGSGVDRSLQQIMHDDAYTTDHQMLLPLIEDGDIYEVVLSGTDYGNTEIKQVIPEYTLSGTHAAPLISRVRTEASLLPGNDHNIQLIVTWTTNKLATSQVRYRSGFAPAGTAFSSATTLDTNLTTKHVVVITGLDAGTVYQLQVESSDDADGTSVSDTITVLTPQKEQSVFQVIMGNVEELFSWVGNLK